MLNNITWYDTKGDSISITTTEEEKTKEKEIVKKYLANMKAETMSKLDNNFKDNKQELNELFKLLKAIEFVKKYIVEMEKEND